MDWQDIEQDDEDAPPGLCESIPAVALVFVVLAVLLSLPVGG